MVKLILCMLIVFSGALLGAYYSRRLIRRRDTLASFLAMLRRASIMMSYEAADLCEVFRDNVWGYDFRYDTPFDVQWQDLVKRYRTCLSEKDAEVLADFVRNMGVTDIDSQQRHFEMYARLIEEQLEQAREEIAKKSKLYQVLPLSAGIVASLLLI